jgi:hypothetical protein
MKIANFLWHPARKRAGFQCFDATGIIERRIAVSARLNFESRLAEFSLGWASLKFAA